MGRVIPASQLRWINIKSAGAIDEWGVWRPNAIADCIQSQHGRRRSLDGGGAATRD